MNRTIILGAGFGGIAAAHDLKKSLGNQHEVILIDRSPQFMMGLRKPWATVGAETLDAGRRNRTALRHLGVEFVQQQITGIDPVARRVETDSGSFDGDYLIVALGADPRPDLVPGLSEHAHSLYASESIPALADAVAQFGGGTLHILIAGVPYKCPPAPYETAMLLDEHLRERGLRDQTDMQISTVQPLLMPNAGKQGSEWLGEQLTTRGIEWHVGRKIKAVQATHIAFEDGDAAFDLLIGIPPHRPPAVIQGSGLAGKTPWIDVDPATLRTNYDNVFAIGDVTAIKLANGLPLPKAGLFAELEGHHVASTIAAELRETAAPAAFDGKGYCYIEMSRSAAALVTGQFFATPEPRVELGTVSAENSLNKHRFEAERLTRWFGA